MHQSSIVLSLQPRRKAHLLPSSLLLRQSPKRLIKWVSDNSPHSHIPGPHRIDSSLPQQMHKRLLSLFDGLEPIMWDERVVGEVRACRKDGGGGERKPSSMGTHGKIGLICGGRSIRVAKGEEGVF